MSSWNPIVFPAMHFTLFSYLLLMHGIFIRTVTNTISFLLGTIVVPFVAAVLGIRIMLHSKSCHVPGAHATPHM